MAADQAPDRRAPRTTRERKIRKDSERIPTIIYLDPKYGVVRDRQDVVGNDLTAVMRWCETHSEVVWLYNDGSHQCPQAMVIEHDDGTHVLTDPPFRVVSVEYGDHRIGEDDNWWRSMPPGEVPRMMVEHVVEHDDNYGTLANTPSTDLLRDALRLACDELRERRANADARRAANALAAYLGGQA